jgi:hypothetical protein
MDSEWGEWARPVPLLTAPMRVTWDSCEILPRTTRSRSGRWDGVAVRYRSTADSSVWETDARLAAWARPRGTSGSWPFAALAYMSYCYPSSDKQRVHSGVPRWRWSWVIYSPDLIEPVRPHVPSEYWAQCCSAVIGGLVAEIGRPRVLGALSLDRWNPGS